MACSQEIAEVENDMNNLVSQFLATRAGHEWSRVLDGHVQFAVERGQYDENLEANGSLRLRRIELHQFEWSELARCRMVICHIPQVGNHDVSISSTRPVVVKEHVLDEWVG